MTTKAKQCHTNRAGASRERSHGDVNLGAHFMFGNDYGKVSGVKSSPNTPETKQLRINRKAKRRIARRVGRSSRI